MKLGAQEFRGATTRQSDTDDGPSTSKQLKLSDNSKASTSTSAPVVNLSSSSNDSCGDDGNVSSCSSCSSNTDNHIRDNTSSTNTSAQFSSPEHSPNNSPSSDTADNGSNTTTRQNQSDTTTVQNDAKPFGVDPMLSPLAADPYDVSSGYENPHDPLDIQEQLIRLRRCADNFEQFGSTLANITEETLVSVKTLDDIREMSQQLSKKMDIMQYATLKNTLIDLKYTRFYSRLITINCTEQQNVLNNLISVLKEYHSINLKTKLMLSDDEACANIDLESAMSKNKQSFLYNAFKNYALSAIDRMKQMCEMVTQCLEQQLHDISLFDNRRIESELLTLRNKKFRVRLSSKFHTVWNYFL